MNLFRHKRKSVKKCKTILQGMLKALFHKREAYSLPLHKLSTIRPMLDIYFCNPLEWVELLFLF